MIGPGNVRVEIQMRTEEMDDRVEPLLAAAVSRPRYFASNVVVALGGPTVYVLIAGTIHDTLAGEFEFTAQGLHLGDESSVIFTPPAENLQLAYASGTWSRLAIGGPVVKTT